MRFGSCLSIIVLTAGSFLGGSAFTLADGACCTMSGCEPAADEAACTAIGGFFLPGESCEDDACGVGACCSPDSCVEAEAYPCFFAGRDYQGVGTTCLDDACEIGMGACCNAGVCSEISQKDCDADGGTWLGGGTHCFNDPCDLGSCCAPGTCNDSARFECDDAGGAFVEGTGCDDDGCDVEFGCPLDSLYSQTRSTPFSFEAFTSEASAGFQRWDNYSGAAGAIEDLRWWGLDLEFDGGNYPECVESNNEFEISFHEDMAGFPGAAVCSYTLLVTRTPTGIDYQDRELNEYRVTLPESCILVDGWISILGLGDPDCWFLWMSSPDGDGRSICSGCQQEEQQSDLSFCLIGTFGEVFGACCDQSTADCNDNIEINDCAKPGLRFAPDELCEELDPPCGVINGACCFDDGACESETSEACADAGGDWLGANTQCSACPCVTPCPANGIPEGEPVCTDAYVDEFNGGCDAETEAFSPISMCDTICGEGGVFEVGPELVPEFDWYEITLEAATELNWTVESEFPILAAIVDGNAGCAGAEVLAIDVALECTPLTVTFELEPGIYWLVVGAFEASDLAVCGAKYTAEVTGSAGECACPEDLDGNGAVDAFDLALLLGSWGKCPGCQADLDGNGAVEAFDLALLLGAWGPCS